MQAIEIVKTHRQSGQRDPPRGRKHSIKRRALDERLIHLEIPLGPAARDKTQEFGNVILFLRRVQKAQLVLDVLPEMSANTSLQGEGNNCRVKGITS